MAPSNTSNCLIGIAASLWLALMPVDAAAGSRGKPSDSDCPADIDTNGVVNHDDLEVVLLLWNHFGTDADVNNDLIVDVFDLLEVLAAWGPCPQR